MRYTGWFFGFALLLLLLLAPPVFAQDAHVVAPEEMDGMVAERSQAADADRATLRAFLERPEVRRAGAVAGIDLRKAESAVAVLSEEDARRLADRALELDKALAGGSDVIVISTTTLIIALLILLIILVA